MRPSRLILSIVGFILLLMAVVSYAIHAFTASEMETALAGIHANAVADTKQSAEKADHALKQIYQNIRTLSLLPDVRSMERHAENLGPGPRETIQQIYNNLWSNVSVSEIYFVPESFDPSRTDPVTGKTEEPALMYDEMITGDSAKERPEKVETELDKVTEQPEPEDQEYALLTKQIAYFREKVPQAKMIKGLDVPVISGPLVITCDNTDFNTTLKDQDREGLVISVPYYKPDGSFGGVVAAIVRLRVLQQYLPESDSALVHTGYQLTVSAANPGQAAASGEHVAAGKADPNLFYSDVVELSLPDPNGKWAFWRGLPQAAIDSDPAVAKVTDQAIFGYTSVFVGGLGLIALVLAFSQRILQPAQRITAALLKIAGGKLDEDVPYLQRRDMLGEISRAVLTFRDKVVELREADAARAAGDADRLRSQKEREDDARRRAGEILFVVDHLGAGLERLASYDLSATLDQPFSEDFEKVRRDFNRSVDAIQQALEEVLVTTHDVLSTSTQMSSIADDLAHRSERQAAAVEQSSAALEQINVTVGQSRGDALKTRKLAGEARQCSDQSGAIVENAMAAMERIQRSSSEIGKIIEVIEQISFQTNLLALNAGVEAARAGEAGKGFAVVAHEVRELARRCSDAAHQISDLIGKSAAEVNAGVGMVKATGEALQTIGGYVEAIDTSIAAITTGIEEQASGLAEITSGLHEIDEGTQRNASLSQSTAHLSGELSQKANELAHMIQRFKLNNRNSGQYRAQNDQSGYRERQLRRA